MSNSHEETSLAFQHQEISEDEIRLLQCSLVPGSKDLHITTKIVNRSSAPPYLALSYVWGAEAATETVFLDRKLFRIRPNLRCFLGNLTFHIWRDFRDGLFTASPYREEKKLEHIRDIHIWVDAICIDQNNVSERNHQVLLMGQIFQRAQHVCAWFGDEDVMSSSQPDLADVYRPDMSDIFIPFPRYEDLDSNWDVGYESEDTKWTKPQSKLMVSLLNRSYWTRCWVVPEYILAENVILLAPNLCMSEQDFIRISNKWDYSIRRDSDMHSHVSKADKFLDMLDKSRKSAGSNHGKMRYARDLAHFLVRYHHCDCLDPRDRIFSLLGLLKNWQGPALKRYLPDYSLSYDEILVITLANMKQYRLFDQVRAESVLSQWSTSWKDVVAAAGAFHLLYPAELLDEELRNGRELGRQSTGTTHEMLRSAFEFDTSKSKEWIEDKIRRYKERLRAGNVLGQRVDTTTGATAAGVFVLKDEVTKEIFHTN